MKPEVTVKAHKESFLLLVRIPYLSKYGIPDTIMDHGRSKILCDNFDSNKAGRGSWVHEAWFVVVKTRPYLLSLNQLKG